MSAKIFLLGIFCCLLTVKVLSGAHVSTTDLPQDITTTEPLDTTTVGITDVDKTTTTESTTAKSTSTSAKTTPTTAKSTTSSSTTTPASTTAQTTPSTTAKPTSTVPPSTTAAPPAPSPTPLPDPEVGTWYLNNSETNLTCVILRMALRMKIPYKSTVNETMKWGQVNLAKNANFTGKCDETAIKSNVSQVRLSWDNNTNYLDITFKRYNDSKSFNITRLYLAQNISGDAFPNNSVSGMVNYQGSGSGLFAVTTVPLGTSYRCSHKVNVNLTEVNAPMPNNATLVFSKVQMQAFVNTTSGTFGGVYDCPGLDTSDIVPIAVGCALAGLVIGVLIAYLVGRRRSHARGYLSM